MTCIKPPPFINNFADARTVVFRSAPCWLKSWWEIGLAFNDAWLHPTPIGGVPGVVIHAYLLAEFPTMYDLAFNHWKMNMGFRTNPDDGHDPISVYPIPLTWIRSFNLATFYFPRGADNQPVGCVCCINQPDCFQHYIIGG